MISAFTDTLPGFDSRRGNNIFWLGAFACVKASPYFPPKSLHKHCFPFLLDRRNEKQRLCIILGGKWGALWDLGVCCPFGVLHLTLTAWRLGYKWKYTPMNANSLLRLSFSHKVKCYDVKNEIKVILNISSYKKLDTFYCTSSEFPEEARLRVLASAMFVHWIFPCGEDGYDPFHTCNCRSKWCSNAQTLHE